MALYDPGTRRHAEAIGVAPGWRRLEVGGGGGYPRVPSDVEILHHDVAAGPPPQREFDLVHARLLLLHAPQRGALLRSLVSALKPGGWLLVEDVDCRILGCQDGAAEEPAHVSVTGGRTASDTLVVARVLRAMGRIMTSNGVDLAYGRKLHGLLSGAGLVDIAVEGHLETGAGGSPLGALHRANMEQLRDQMVASGMVTGREIDRACHVVMDPGSAAVTPGIMISARGRRPR
ncbi:MAG TPA: methyltransferase domain-containing protein [Candidatus Dormibacteraeota bacterium]|nr:methyltransferase domain-containing protein [Candidatus Dormibacteraeota bacterium]